MKPWQRITLNVPVWAVWWFFIELLPFFPGLIASIVNVAFRSKQVSPVNGNIITNGVRWLWWFCNDEDGMESDEAKRHYFSWAPAWFNMYWWMAVRNYARNQGFVKAMYPPPDPSRIQSIVSKNGLLGIVEGAPKFYPTWELTWQGWRHHLTWRYSKTSQLTLGWKYYPQDANPDADYGWRSIGCGFAARREQIS